MKCSTLKLPLATLEEGQGFFIPCLDHDAVIQHVVEEAILAGVRLAWCPGIKDGAIGVLFLRRTRGPGRFAPRGSKPAPHPFELE